MEKIKKIILKYKSYILCAIILILSIVSIIIQSIDRRNTSYINNEEMKQRSGKIVVYITGAVKNPGVYYLDENARLSNALDICGGILENADLDKLNLAQKLVDSDKITVPIKQENESTDNQNEANNDSKVNINTATKEKLKELNGIGESTAQKIIEYRKVQEFLEIEDIMNVPGIGESKFENIKDDICV